MISPATPFLTSLVRYGLVSALSFVSILGITAFLHEIIGAGEEWAFAIALVSVFFLNFWLMRMFVYPGQTRGAAGQFLQTLGASLGFRVLEYAAFLLLHTGLGMQYLATSAVVLIASFCAKFIFYRHVVFAHD